MVYGLWSFVYDLWFVVCGLWFVVCGDRDTEFQINQSLIPN